MRAGSCHPSPAIPQRSISCEVAYFLLFDAEINRIPECHQHQQQHRQMKGYCSVLPTNGAPVRIQNVPDFWERVCRSEHNLLVLDYDGTLAPFRVDPMQAYPLAGVRATLRASVESNRFALAILSGRPVHELRTLLGQVSIPLIGCHGFEVLDPEGNITLLSPTPEQLEALERATAAIKRCGYAEMLETKTASLALHTRGRRPRKALQIEERVMQEWRRFVSPGVGMRRFNGGVELFCSGRTKGDALKDLIREQPEGTFTVYVGDDETDEDAFRVLGVEVGIGIKVGLPSKSTAAKGFLPDCESVKAFLGSWLSLLN